ncbi:FBP domain-containing protein [Streptomyces sp. NPDC048172]|uniref:FBP domain-containing protein n=1 Tax=Streptomyces sp. NPDC048172 TaxID=3365505 RepID=UPI003714110E
MRAAREPEIRASFVNCSRGEAKRLTVPRDLDARPWDDLDFLGWRDPGAPDRRYLVAEREDRLIGVVMRVPSQPREARHHTMCSVCLTTHPGDGVTLMAAPRAGKAGREGNTVGAYLCNDLACSLYVRGKKTPPTGGRLKESLSLDDQIARTRTHLFTFLDKLNA